MPIVSSKTTDNRFDSSPPMSCIVVTMLHLVPFRLRVGRLGRKDSSALMSEEGYHAQSSLHRR